MSLAGSLVGPCRRLRDLLAGPDVLLAPGVYDGLSARIAQRCGFDAVYVSGGAVARSTGVPDLGLTTLTETAARIAQIVDAVSVPVIADADTGYGNALNVWRTVREFERAGAAALHIEDQVTPKRCGHYDGKQLVTTSEMHTKIQAALDACTDPDLVVIARTDAIAVEGFDAAIVRARAYADAGADLIFVEAPTSEAQIRRVAAEIDHPLMINMFAGGKTPLVPAARLAEYGYRLMIAPSDLQRAAIKAMDEVAATLLRDGSTAAVADRMATFAERDEAVDLARFEQLEHRYAVDVQASPASRPTTSLQLPAPLGPSTGGTAPWTVETSRAAAEATRSAGVCSSAAR